MLPFVAVLGMGVAGAALATTIALYLSWLASILYARRNYEVCNFPCCPMAMIRRSWRPS